MKREIRLGINTSGKLFIIMASILLSLSIPTIFSERAMILISLSFVIYSLLIIDWLLIRIRITALEQLKISRVFNSKVYNDDRVDIRIYVENISFFGLYLMEITDIYPSTTKLVSGVNKGVFSLPSKSTIVFRYVLYVNAVGTHRFGGIYIRMKDPIGIFTVNAMFREIDKNRLMCLAKTPSTKIDELLYKGLKILQGPLRIKKTGYSLEFKEIREYKPGDEIKRIDWKASARINKLMIRDFEMEGQSDIVIILDLSRNMFLGKLGERKLDYSAKCIAFIITYAIRKKDRLGIMMLKTGEYKILPLEYATHETYRKIMEMLSEVDVESVFNGKETVEVNFGRVLSSLKVKERTLFIVLSDLEEPERALKIINALKIIRSLKHEVVIISPLTYLFEMPLVKGIDALLYRIEGYKSMVKRKGIEKELVKTGIPIVNVGPEDLIPVVLSRLEEFRRRTPS